ncbi:FkbM family methyltransferase [Paenacidovorax monticola]|uniref:FkbM family methyltransferase n=1 Tax=Paenacidovorax monticola TaxID=1926868 RepID=A0A7H0HEP4_9BURK|nr:FkbM family methyltransferase [Paenacidovorax monticola]QNP59010.1 FkbM family methyltransferase [Paenacidovorax monticola]
MKILICGMPRSMTTWAFNAAREIVADQNLKTVWIEPSDTAAEEQFATANGNVLAKCHHYSEVLAKAADCVIYSYRDIRTAAVSYFRKFSSDCDTGQLNAWVQAGRAWMQVADTVLRYEQVERGPANAIRHLRQVLAKKYGAEVLSRESDEVLLSRIDETFALRQTADVADYDAQTMILPAHRTFQPAPDDLNAAEKALYLRIEREFAPWLAEHFYIQQEDHGQALDYRLAANVMARLARPVVIDVGVERGSFIDLALSAGAERIIAFEALPRHVEHLNARFAHEPRVEVRAKAVSERSGKAVFHIAIDPEGRELDYHHTLADLGDSITVVRSERSIEVETVALGALAVNKQLPEAIDFLKVDTDGHDLAVLRGLEGLRPRFILAEYWDTLPETSGRNLYSLADLQTWAAGCGYSHSVVIRRHGRLESLEWDAPWTQAGDWGNVLFIRDVADLAMVRAVVAGLAPEVQQRNHDYLATLVKECEAKEAVIRRLDNEVKALLGQQHVVDDIESEEAALLKSLEDVPAALPSDPASTSCKALEAELIRKEIVIRKQARALAAYRVAFPPLSPFLRSIGFVGRHLRAALRPRLGNLNQYLPRRLELPKPYVCGLPAERLPSISMVTPSFQQARFVGRTIDSVLSQNYPRLDYFVQDGGSTDGTADVLKSYGDRLTGWVSQKDGGQSQAINLGFARASGEIMAWLNSDDLLMPGALHRVGEYFAQHPEVDVVYGNRILIDEEDREIGRWVLPAHDDEVLSWADFIPQETLFWRRSIWEKAGGRIDESFRFAMDWDLLQRFRSVGARMVRLPDFLGAFRIHNAQKTSVQINEVGMEEMARLRRRALGLEVSWGQIHRALMPYLIKHVVHDLAYRIKR